VSVATKQTGAKKQRGRTNRDDLFRIAAELFASQGYHGTGLSDLERATGLGRGSIYHYVSSKDDLLYGITTQYLIRLIAAGEDLLGRDLAPDERLRLMSREVMTVITENLPEMTVCFRDMHEVPDPMRAEVLDLHRRYERVWEETLQKGVESGHFRTSEHLVVKAILGLHHYAYLWVRPDGPKRPEEIADVFVDLVVNGVGVRTA
jgi:AcrR family transcriptional regulator